MITPAEKKTKTILVARIWHESNAFNPEITGPDAFEYSTGEQFLDAASDSGSTIGGIISQLRTPEVKLIGSVSATAPPSGLVDHGFFLNLKDQFLKDVIAHQPDAIALDLHGAMATTKAADAEGMLLVELRHVVGPGVPIAIGLDLHANVTVDMIESVDICIACKENPHSDVVECGHKVAECLLAVLDGRLTPATTMAKVPMILPGSGETASGPLFDIHEMARAYAKAQPDIWDISVFNVFRYADDYDIGQAVVVTSNGKEQAVTPARTLARMFWDRRHDFVDELVSIEEALATADQRQGARPYVLADMGDRILAGAPGDSTAILEAALKDHPKLRGAVSVTDSKAVRRAQRAGVGASVEIEIGGRLTPGFRPFAVRAVVQHLSDGCCSLDGPYQQGTRCAMGDTAVLEIEGRVLVLLTSRPAFSHDPAIFTSQGIELSDLDFIVVKSGYHFKLNFAAIAEPLLVRTPGIGYYEKGFFTYQRARFWPEQEDACYPISTRVRRPPSLNCLEEAG